MFKYFIWSFIYQEYAVRNKSTYIWQKKTIIKSDGILFSELIITSCKYIKTFPLLHHFVKYSITAINIHTSFNLLSFSCLLMWICDCGFKTTHRQVSFYARVTFLKNVAQMERKIPIQNIVFPGG